MKRLVLLATVLAFVLGMASMASAATMKASGEWALEFLFSDNFDMNDRGSADGDGDFNVYQRARTQFDFIANENLKGVLATEIGTARWGDYNATSGAGFHFHDHSTGISVRRAYLDFMVPDTTVAVHGGLQGIALPASFGGGNMILDDEMPALVVSTPIIDEVSVLAGYGRMYDFANSTITAGTENTSFDTGFLALPVKLDGFDFAPYFVYAYLGEAALRQGVNLTADTNANSVDMISIMQGLVTPGATNYGGRNAYFVGTNFTMTYFDPIKVMADVAYGSVSSSQGGDANERNGWAFDLAVDYTGLDFMTPEVFFAYTSGDDDKASNGSERMPALSSRTYGIGSFWFANDTLLKGSKGYTNDMTGFWTVGLSLKDISFLEKLSHTFTVMYIQGTNDKAVANAAYQTNTTVPTLYNYGYTLTEEDHVVEFDLNNKYQLYDELALTLDLGYINNGYDKDTWSNVDRENAYKVSTGLLYQF